MSAAVAKRTSADDAVDLELAKWPGVTWSRSVRGKHYQLVLTYRGNSRFVIYAATPSDGVHGLQNHLTDVRAELRALGAQKTPTVKATTQRRKRNVTEPSRLTLVKRKPAKLERDPWAALSGFTPQPKAAEPTPPRGLMHWLAALWNRRDKPW